MRRKSVNALNGGEILAEPIRTEKEEILIPKGTKLKKDYVSLIRSLGYENLMIEDPYENFERPHPIIDRSRLDTFVNRVQKLMERHIYHQNHSLKEFEVIANELVKEVDGMSKDVVIDMNERTANLYEHTVMVTLLSLLVGRKMNLDRKRLYDMAIGCLLHDIGIRYITVKYENCDMNKGDPASIFEYKKHTIFGYSALEKETWVPRISKKMILSHHEKLDGSGFPMKQKTSETECKIIQACDAFDRYISGMECIRTPVWKAIDKITAESGIRYEREIVQLLVSMVARYPVGTQVKTNEQEDGIVISQTMEPEKPIILVIDDKKIDSEKKEKEYNLMLEKHISILPVV